ncbi:L-aspartate oxidase [Desulfatiferula olefinivorans]
MTAAVYRCCDILIVGSGLAGLRAGIAAQSGPHDLDVCLVAPGKGPSGSSFTNPNRALGMVVCRSDRDKEAFLSAACAIAAPGFIDSALTEVLAEEGKACFDDLRKTGLTVVADEKGRPRRQRACFLKTLPLAYILTDLDAAFFRLKQRFLRHGRMWDGLRLADLVVNEEGRAIGAVFWDRRSGTVLAVQCRALILATGGGAALFARHLTDPENQGAGTALMHRAGADLVNMNYVQYMWYDTGADRFWSCGRIAGPDVRIISPRGEVDTLPETLRDRAAERDSHAPVSHGRPDAALDDYLLSRADDTGCVTVEGPTGVRHRVCLYAHAFNGGARIDAWGQTTVPGLLACGECAGGMHGANRVGGAMVLSGQVFGRRAGMAAIRRVHDAGVEPEHRFRERVEAQRRRHGRDIDERRRGLGDLGRILLRQAGPFPRPEREVCRDRIRSMARRVRDHDLGLALSCARLIVEKSP